MENTGILDWVFIGCTVIGFSLLIARIVLQLSGIGDSGDADIPSDGMDGQAFDDITTDSSPDTAESTEDVNSGEGLRLFTLQGLMGFFLTFGLMGFMSHYLAKLNGMLSALLALSIGFFSMWITAKLFSSLMKLESSGTIDIRNSIGKEGTVYQRILPGQTGKVQIVIQGRLVEYEAISSRNIEIKTGDPVMVTYYKGNVLIVDKI